MTIHMHDTYAAKIIRSYLTALSILPLPIKQALGPVQNVQQGFDSHLRFRMACTYEMLAMQ